MIWLAAAVLVAALAGLLWRPGARIAAVRRDAINREALADALDDIERRRDAGELSAEAAQALIDELARRVPEETGADTGSGPAMEAPRLRLVAIGLLVAAVGAYALAGSWRVAERVALAEAHPELTPKLQLDHLREYVQSHPRDASAWAALGAQEFSNGQYAAAADAYAEANGISGGNNADWLVGQGESLAMRDDRRLGGEPEALFRRALEIDNEHPRGLWFTALAAMQQGRESEAVALWKRMAELDSVPPHVREVLQRQIADAAGGDIDDAAQPVAPPAVSAGGSSPRLTLRVELPGVDGPQPGALFVFARPQGQRAGPPLAVKRIANPRFPVELTLGDDDAMMPGHTMSAHPAWTITARLNASGSVEADTGSPSASADIDASASGDAYTLHLKRP